MEQLSSRGKGPKIVAIGGGTGTSMILEGLKAHTPNLTAIVTMFDSGGSTGLLRREYGLPPFGDLRRCLLALGEVSEETAPIRAALEYRFGGSSSLNGHSVGNLFMAALTSLSDDLERCVEQLSGILRVRGSVLPVTLGHADLCAELADGRILHGEADIDQRAAPLPRIERVYLDRQVEANPVALRAVREADAIVIGPGDLYTSILPVFLVDGMGEALAESSATRIFVCNLMTKRGETDGFQASDFLREFERYAGADRLDWAIVNTAIPPGSVQAAYDQEGATVVEPDTEAVGGHVNGIFASSLATLDLPVRHDPLALADAVIRIIQTGRAQRHRSSLMGTATEMLAPGSPGLVAAGGR
jgi:uncharacterized cofD-like protein